ncbi:flavodoxin family protein [Radiobacillus deserti]|uniref:flavodoxin family protein n=1 Tax=Radiobacillus deserti TaxID=2594883 RepID=UPI0013159D25|nr:flavodoxin family protein [Radiobacillus deserti]
MTSKAIYYFSLTGNTKAMLSTIEDLEQWDIYDLNTMRPEEVTFKGYDTVLIGTLTIGRGNPPSYFKRMVHALRSMQGVRIGLFGSGQTHYGDDYCGALDVLEDFLQPRNEIAFKMKYESYPVPSVMEEFKQLVKEMQYEDIKV